MLEENVKETSEDVCLEVTNRPGLREQFLTRCYAGIDEMVPLITLFFSSAM